MFICVSVYLGDTGIRINIYLGVGKHHKNILKLNIKYFLVQLNICSNLRSVNEGGLGTGYLTKICSYNGKH